MLKVVSWMLAFSSSSFATDSELPKPLSIVEKQGGEVISRFDAPSQMTGYVIDFKGNAITVYVTEDGQYMLAGKMFDANGQDVGANELNNYINGAQSEKIWQQLSESSWVLDGNPNASRVVYAFTDPNCPYCQKFWQQARPWVDAGNVQIRTDYTGIKIGYDSGYNFDFEISTEYAGVSGKDDFEINISKEKSTEKYYSGYYGSPNSGNKVSITSDYGGISFYRN